MLQKLSKDGGDYQTMINLDRLKEISTRRNLENDNE